MINQRKSAVATLVPGTVRLLIATSDYPPAVGGMAEYSDAWARELAALGAEVRVLARRGGELPQGRAPAVAAETVAWHPGPFADPWHACRHLRRAIAKHRPNLVLAHTWIGWGPALAWLKGRIGIKYVLAAHGAEVLGPAASPYYRFLMRQAFKAADRIFPVSSFTADHVAALGISRERIEVIGNGVDTERFRPAPRNPELVARFGLTDRETIVTVGGLVDRKGHDLVIRAVALLKDKRPRLSYVIAGGWALNSSREPHLRQLAADCGVADRVVFTGFVEDAQLPDIYRLGDLFVMPGREVAGKGWVEGFGISYLDAAACGLPVIATRTGGVTEAVTDTNGVFVPVEDPAAVAEAITRLLDAPDQRRTMAEAGLAWATQNTWRSQVERSWEILATLAD